MAALIRRLKRPMVKIIKGLSTVVKIGLMNKLSRVKIPTTIRIFLKSVEIENPGM